MHVKDLYLTYKYISQSNQVKIKIVKMLSFEDNYLLLKFLLFLNQKGKYLKKVRYRPQKTDFLCRLSVQFQFEVQFTPLNFSSIMKKN